MIYNYQWLIDGYIQAAAVYGVIALLVTSFLMTTIKGRAVLRHWWSSIRRRPMLSLFVALGVYVGAVCGETKPPPIITEKGIELTKVQQDANGVSLEWVTTDERIPTGAKFLIQERFPMGWGNIAETTAKAHRLNGFTLDRNHVYRIVVNAGEIEAAQ